MQIVETSLRDLKLLHPRKFGDDRGWFAEVFNTETFQVAGIDANFVQDNQSFSRRGVLRGLHYQLERPQGKLIRVLAGHIWDVAVDIRRSSPTFGRWAGFDLQSLNASGEIEMLWIPAGFAHGFLVMSETAEVLYKTTDFYHPAGERSILWDDPKLAIGWPLDQISGTSLSLSPKDLAGRRFADADVFA